jgi:hypothetical protein
MRRLLVLIAALACLVLLSALIYFVSGQHRVAAPLTATATSCHSTGGLPDPRCTPGVADPRVTQDNIYSTICVSGYTATVRPPSTFTDSLKAQQITEYGYADTDVADYEEDHLIPLELGGHPTDRKNLWPEPRGGAESAADKDRVETALNKRVCAGTTTLAAAQSAIASDWQTAES